MMTMNDIALNKAKITCFTGHRPGSLCGYCTDGYMQSRIQLTDLVIDAAEKDIVNFVTGGTQGIDQLAFWAVEHAKVQRPGLGIKNILVLPFPGFGRHWKATGTFSQAELAMAVRRADRVVYAADKEPSDKRDAVRLLMARNNAMIELSGTMFAIYESEDWADPGTRSGTAAAIREAKKSGLEINRIGYMVSGNIMLLDMSGIERVPASDGPDFLSTCMKG